ncbi:MAG TPA: universal stress protein [bacterium]|nr:universal stress protein [bacterium]HQI49536.1 universal stress protein [bacterium]HQJ64714.1 universal stress protein [bacterium]
MFKSILLAVDGSAYTESILAHGIELAQRFASRLLILTVADVRIFEWASAVGSDGFISIAPSGSYQEASRTLLAEKCDKILAKCRERLACTDLDFSMEKSFGAPADLILEQTQIADLLVMGKQGEFARWNVKGLGATVDAVSRMTHKPLLVAGLAYRPIRRILVGYDGSEHANRALQYAAHIAEAGQATIGLLCINDDAELAAHNCERAKAYLQSYRVTVESVTLPGHPEEVLVRYCGLKDYDLIAIGAYGHSRIREALLGSTTTHLLRQSTFPVLLAK